MDRFEFIVPVRLVPHPDEPVTEIYNIDEALSFLQNWDGDQQSPVYQVALNRCFGAKVDLYGAEDARRALAGFCRNAGISARDMPHAVMVDVDGEIRGGFI